VETIGNKKKKKLSLLTQGNDTDELLYPPQIRGLACDFLSYRVRAVPLNPEDSLELFQDEDTNNDDSSDRANDDNPLPISLHNFKV